MNNKFDETIAKAVKKSSYIELSDNFTEKVISRVLIYNRSKQIKPLLPKEFFIIAGIIISLISIILFVKIENTPNIGPSYNFKLIDISNITEFLTGYSMEFSFVIFLLGILIIIDFLAGKFFSRKII